MAVNYIGLIVFVVGIALIIAEAFTPGTFIIVPGVSLLVVGALLMAFPDLALTVWTPVVFIIAFIIAFIPVFYFYKNLSPPRRPTTTSSDALVGRVGTVVHNVSPGNIRGKVLIDQVQWSATADQVIPKGKKVKVERVQGVKVIVRPFEERAAGDWEETLEVEA